MRFDKKLEKTEQIFNFQMCSQLAGPPCWRDKWVTVILSLFFNAKKSSLPAYP